MLALKIERKGYTYKQEIVAMDSETIADSHAIFEEWMNKGVIRADRYDANRWTMSNQVQKHVTLDFTLDEVHFAQETTPKLQCSLSQYKQAMRLVTTSLMGTALLHLQAAVTAMRNYANSFEIPTDYSTGQIIADLLYLLPGDSQFRMDTINAINDLEETNRLSGNQRNLAYYQSYLKFDFYLDRFWATASEEEQIMYFPIYYWFKITGVIPLRPTECVLTPRNCIRYAKDRAWLTLRRSKQKGLTLSSKYNISEDYSQSEYPIAAEVALAIETYISRTRDVYQSDIDVLFCKTSQFAGFGIVGENDFHYTYANLRQCLSRFYSEILCGRFGLSVTEGPNELMDGEIERIHLGDTRHIALINLFNTTQDPLVCKNLAGHVNAAMSAHYSTNRRQFLDAYAYMRIRELNGRYDSHHALVTEHMPMVCGGKGYCANSAFSSKDFSACALAVDAYGIAGECTVCKFFIPKDHAVAAASKGKTMVEFDATCKLYFKELEMLRQGLGNQDTLTSLVEKLHTQELQYTQLSAIERMWRNE